MNDRELSHNASGYSDPTAYAAFKRIGVDKDTVRKVRQGIYLLCDLAGLRVEGRIVLVDKKDRPNLEMRYIYGWKNHLY